MEKTIAIPKKAATVILLRESRPEGFEVFLLKRHEKSSFMGGNYVYPGGRVDQEDGSIELCSRCKGVTLEEAHQLFGRSIPPEESLSYWIAGVRELFEEAGILFAYDQGQTLVKLRDKQEGEKFLQYRTQLQKGETTISKIAQQENLFFALDHLHYYAHWITPEARTERFDTRFFLACHPVGQEASFDQKETTAGVWLTPQKGLEKNLRGEVVLSPPTLKTLEDLSRFKRVKEIFDSLKGKEIQPILPILTKIAETPVLVFPWDPDYKLFQKGVPSSPVDHGRSSHADDNTTRLLLKKRVWYPYCRTE